MSASHLNFLQGSASKMRKLFTLALVRNPSTGDILLGLKKRGLGERKWNGFGGKVEPGESISEATVRELKEECGLQAKSLTPVGCVNFQFLEGPDVVREMHIFSTNNYSGCVTESNEMLPKWYKIEDIPLKEIWQDMSIWIPFYLKGDRFIGYFLYDKHDTILDYNIKVLESSSIEL